MFAVYRQAADTLHYHDNSTSSGKQGSYDYYNDDRGAKMAEMEKPRKSLKIFLISVCLYLFAAELNIENSA